MLADWVSSLLSTSSALEGVEVQYDPVEVLGNMLWLMAGMALPKSTMEPSSLMLGRRQSL